MALPVEHSWIKKYFKGVEYTLHPDDGSLHVLTSGTDLTLDSSEIRALFDLLVWTEPIWRGK